MSASPLLVLQGFGVSLAQDDGSQLPILSDIGFELGAGDTLGIVGESGSGKSLLALALIGLLPEQARQSGRIVFDGLDIAGASESDLCEVRGQRIAMIFQEPATALNPAMRIGDQITEGMRWRGTDRRTARRHASDLLDRVRLSDARSRIDAYPHELSGGQRQRVMIAIALSQSPALLIADEPTTALDASVARSILDLLGDLAREEQMALILVSHDLAAVERATARMLVMYAGTSFELGDTAALLAQPANPYTKGLIAAMPRRDVRANASGAAPRFATIPGTVPVFDQLPPGCRFANRCPLHIPACDDGEPSLRKIGSRRLVRCIRAEPEGLPR